MLREFYAWLFKPSEAKDVDWPDYVMGGILLGIIMFMIFTYGVDEQSANNLRFITKQ